MSHWVQDAARSLPLPWRRPCQDRSQVQKLWRQSHRHEGHRRHEGTKRIGAGSKGDSFLVSKIWQWPRNGKGKLPVLASDDSSAKGRRASPGGGPKGRDSATAVAVVVAARAKELGMRAPATDRWGSASAKQRRRRRFGCSGAASSNSAAGWCGGRGTVAKKIGASPVTRGRWPWKGIFGCLPTLKV